MGVAMRWSNEQLEAITKKGCNIIVSAGAGSGKTAVLTQRIFEIIKSGVDVSRLLVLTFTNAAAKEMKERVIKKISEDELLVSKKADVLASNITTFDAYSFSLVKKYYHVLGISPDINIADSMYIKSVKRTILDDIVLKEYEFNDIDLIFNNFKSKNDRFLKEFILDLSYEFDLIVDNIEFLDSYIENFYNEGVKDKLIGIYESLAIESFNDILDLMVDLKNETCNEKIIDYIENFTYNYDSIKTYDELLSVVSSLRIPNLKEASDKEKDIKNNISELVKKLKADFLTKESKEVLCKEFFENKEIVRFVLKLLKELYLGINEYKFNNNYFEFNDIAKMAIKLVRDNSDVCLEIKNSLYEILVDEYQDTSDIQETFLNYITNNNLYMVGDIKQSIYRFRNANPYIFKNKYDAYSKSCGGYKIDLNQNFRSRSEVLDNINLIFSQIMTNEFGDADYKKSHQMNFGLTSYNKEKMNSDYNMQILRYSDDIEGYKQAQIEAFIVADDILSKLDSYMIFDKDSNCLRKAKFKDFCIIIDRNTNFELYKKIFEYKGIPLNIVADQNLNESDISKIFYNIINMIVKSNENNFDSSYYHSFCSVARSFIFEYSDDLIYKIVTNKDISNEVSKIMLEASKFINTYSINYIIDYVFDKLDIYYKIRKVANVNKNLIELEYITSLCNNLEQLGNGVDSILTTLSNMLNLGDPIKYNMSSEQVDSVNIMNIHKSKGLEFPICYFSMLDSNYNQSDYSSRFGYFSHSGIYTPTLLDNSNNVCKTVGIQLTKKEDISEKIRLFYVALTRVREQIIILSPKLDRYNKVSKHKNLNELLYNALPSIYPFIKDVSISDKLSKDYLFNNKGDININACEEVLYDNTLIKSTEVVKDRISMSINNVINETTRKNIDLGLKLHEAMEFVDFKTQDLSNIKDVFVLNKIKGVLNLDLFKNIKEAKTLKEHEFMFSTQLKDYHGIIDLVAIYPDHIDIIDYKLSNLEHDEYTRQLRIYHDYVKIHYDKKINCYLLSILNLEVKKVEV